MPGRCWDGKNLDSPDHQSHVAYGQGSGANGGGACPSSHPVKLPQIMYELMWNVTTFADKNLWPSDGSKPFVYSMNLGYVLSFLLFLSKLSDSIHSGSAAHGDYVFGWEGDSLQKAMDNGCRENQACPKAGLTTQTDAQYSACTKKQQAPEDVDGCTYLSSPLYSSIHVLTSPSQGSQLCPWARWPSKHNIFTHLPRIYARLASVPPHVAPLLLLLGDWEINSGSG